MRNFLYIFKHEEILIFVRWSQEDLRFKVCGNYIVRPCPKTQNQSNSKSRDSMGKWAAWGDWILAMTNIVVMNSCYRIVAGSLLLIIMEWLGTILFFLCCKFYHSLSTWLIISINCWVQQENSYEQQSLIGLKGGCDVSKQWRMDLDLWSYC